jgi:TPR repeat protein
MERGVEKDVQKAMYHLKMAVINGDGRSRCFLAKYEMKIGNI